MLTKDLHLAFIKPNAAVLASPRTFQPYGQCGIEFSDYIPHIASCADDICLVRSMYTDAFNHHPGQLLLFGGSIQVGRPTMGAWVLYGLGSESQNLPGFVVLGSGVGHQWRNGRTGPAAFCRPPIRAWSSAVPAIRCSTFRIPPGVTTEHAARRARRAARPERRAPGADRRRGDRVAHRFLRAGVPHAGGGPRAARFLQGVARDARRCTASTNQPASQFAANCLLARRMVERGVRFVMLMHASWDDHTDLNRKLKKNCDMADQPTAALIKDLKQRGLLDNTLVVWGGEFGRTPMVRDSRPARRQQRRARSPSAGVQSVPRGRRHQGRAGNRQDGRSLHEHRGG